MSACNPWGYDRPWVSLHQFTWLYAPCLLHFCPILLLYVSDFWVSPLEFIQEDLHLLGRLCELIPTPSPLPLLYLIFLLFSDTLVIVPMIFHLLVGLATIFSQPTVANLHLFLARGRVSFSFSSIFGIEYIDAQLSALLLHTTSIREFP